MPDSLYLLIGRLRIMDKHTDLDTRVAIAILENAKIGQAVIEVEHLDGSIVLKGNTATEQDRRAAENTAFRQEGVVNVINELTCDEP